MLKGIYLLSFIFVSYAFSADYVAEKIVYVYEGPGVSIEAQKHTVASLNEHLPKNTVELLNTYDLLYSNWQKNADLFVMPGGADLPYVKMLNGEGNKKIRQFIENGGSYLGICAGAYYGCSGIEFAKGTSMEVTGDRELAFFPGRCIGPTLSSFTYKSHKGARAAQIEWREEFSSFESKQTDFTVYYIGGGHFRFADRFPETKVLACYGDPEEKPAAIIECKVGEGKAILSGVHVEYDPFELEPEPNLKGKLCPLREGDAGRKVLFRHLLERLLPESYFVLG